MYYFYSISSKILLFFNGCNAYGALSFNGFNTKSLKCINGCGKITNSSLLTISSYKNISKSQWVQEYGNMLNEIIGDRFVPRDVVIIDLNVHEE